MLGRLRDLGVMGINERNVQLVAKLNPRRLHRSVNDKVLSKHLAEAAGIAVPRLYGTIANTLELRGFRDMIADLDGFVIKPALGTQGNGILVVGPRMNHGRQLANGRVVGVDRLAYQVNNILSGMYSMGGQPDKAMLEERVFFDASFDDVSFKGVPDIRVIVLKGYPIAGMLRLPTSASDGKANLHKGGVGVGIDIPTGKTGTAMQYDKPIETHPDTGFSVKGLDIPQWEQILTMAAQSYDVTGLGYLGVDLVLDRHRGPLLLEFNARPGISIQIANLVGLRGAVDRVMAQAAAEPDLDVQGRLAYARRSN